MSLKVRDSLGVTEEFTLYDPDDLSVSADKKIHVINSSGVEKVVPLEVASASSQRSASSRLYYHDGTTKYRACTTKFNYVTKTFVDGYFDEDTRDSMLFKFDGNADPVVNEDFVGSPKSVIWPIPKPESRFEVSSGVYDFLYVAYAFNIFGTIDPGDIATLKFRFKPNSDPYGFWPTIANVIVAPGSSFLMGTVYFKDAPSPIYWPRSTDYCQIELECGAYGDTGTFNMGNGRGHISMGAAVAIA